MELVLSKEREDQLQSLLDRVEKVIRTMRPNDNYEGILLELNPYDYSDMKKDYYCGPMTDWGKILNMKISTNTANKPNEAKILVNGELISDR